MEGYLIKPHTKTYLAHFGYDESSFIPCEMCGQRAVDVHHIDGRGKGMNVIENLIGLCRGCHSRAHGPDSKRIRGVLKTIVGMR